MNKLGIFMNFWELNWAADHAKYINKAADIGFDILEFQAQALLELDNARLRDLRNLAAERGLELTYSLGLNPAYDVSSADEDVRRSGIEYLKRILEKISLMGGKRLSGVDYAGWGSPDFIVDNKAPIVERSLQSMRQVLKTAEDYGILYSFEVVNRFEGCVMNTAEEALAYLAQLDSKNAGILLETYHMNIEETSMGDAIRLVGDKLTGFHTGENNRTPPGRGHLDWEEIFGALRDIGYVGPIVSEPFVRMGGEVGRDIKVWRNLIDIADEVALDEEARRLLAFTKEKLHGFTV